LHSRSYSKFKAAAVTYVFTREGRYVVLCLGLPFPIEPSIFTFSFFVEQVLRHSVEIPIGIHTKLHKVCIFEGWRFVDSSCLFAQVEEVQVEEVQVEEVQVQVEEEGGGGSQLHKVCIIFRETYIFLKFEVCRLNSP
jgi:hypothetical protein